MAQIKLVKSWMDMNEDILQLMKDALDTNEETVLPFIVGVLQMSNPDTLDDEIVLKLVQFNISDDKNTLGVLEVLQLIVQQNRRITIEVYEFLKES